MSVTLAVALAADAVAQTPPTVHPVNEAVLRTWSPEFPLLGPSYAPQMRGPAMAAHAERLLAERPDAIETLEMLLFMERPADAIALMRRIIERRPSDIAQAFTVLRSRPITPLMARLPPMEEMRGLLADARARLPELPRDAAADAAFAILLVELEVVGYAERLSRVPPLEAFIGEYGGTPAALLAQIEIIGDDRDIPGQVSALQAFARAHPGTSAAAKALYQAGFRLARDVVRLGQDPTDAFVRALEIVRELESGRYPASEWVSRAPYLGLELFSPRPTYAPGNAERLLAAYQEYVRGHFLLPGHDAVDTGIGYVINTKMGDLFELTGDRRAGVEQTLLDLERVHAPRAKLLRAGVYLAASRSASSDARAGLVRRATEILTLLRQSEGGALYGRKALATLASLAFDERDYRRARSLFQEYRHGYPATDWSWVAALKIGRSEEALGNQEAAVAAYRAAARHYAAVPAAQVLGHAYAARTNEALGRFADALADYGQALDAWSGPSSSSFPSFSLGERVPPPPGEVIGRDASQIARVALTGRITALTRSVTVAGGDRLERGRLLLERGDWLAARAALEEAAVQAADPAMAVESRSLAHRARVEYAIRLTEAGRVTPAGDATAIAELDGIQADAWDFGSVAAKIAKASILFRQGAEAAARVVMTEALGEWRDFSSSLPPVPSQLPEDVERDVADIRAALFRPQGDGPVGSQFRSVPAGARFVIVNADVFVAEAGREARRVAVFQSFPAVDNVLQLTTGQIDLLEAILTHLFGTERPQQGTPDLLAFWNTFFPARRMFGFGRGWILEAPPVIGGVEFADPARTRALVSVIVGPEGATFHMEKTASGWQLRDVTNRSIA